MTTQQTAALDKLREQQSGVREHTAPWMVAQQLMDICRHDPASAELILQDLDRPAMSIVEAEKKVKAYADAHKNGSFACVPPDESDRILREFYGLPAMESGEQAGQAAGKCPDCLRSEELHRRQMANIRGSDRRPGMRG